MPPCCAYLGLIDSDPVRQRDWDQYDPALGGAGPGRPRYWWLNFARAEHARTYTYADGSIDVCPTNCTAKIEHAVNVSGTGGGYREYVWGPVGDAHPGVGYMHRYGS